MTDAIPWIDQLRGIMQRQASDDDAVEQISLSARDLLDTVPDYEICEALKFWGDNAPDPLTDLLSAECEQRNLDS